MNRASLTWLGAAGGVFLGGVLLLAALAKALDPVAFAGQITAEGLAGWIPAAALVFVALALEVGLGALLLSGVRRLWVLLPSLGLVVFFLALTGRAYWRFAHGEIVEADCGCFGNLVSRTPAEAFWQDLLLMVPALALAFLARPRGPFPRRRVVAAALGTAAVLGFAHLAPGLPLDDLATRLSPGVELSELCIGDDSPVCVADVAPELAEGERWAVLVDLTQDPEAWVDELNALALASATPPLVLAAATPEQLMEFTWTWGPAFEVREAPESLLRPLYRQLPRSFLARDGEVVLTSPGLPPGPVSASK